MVLHARQVDDDGVALAKDLGLGDAERVDALAQLLDREIHALVAELCARLGALRHRDTALQVETQVQFIGLALPVRCSKNGINAFVACAVQDPLFSKLYRSSPFIPFQIGKCGADNFLSLCFNRAFVVTHNPGIG